jgi:hypothetical protein
MAIGGIIAGVAALAVVVAAGASGDDGTRTTAVHP